MVERPNLLITIELNINRSCTISKYQLQQLPDKTIIPKENYSLTIYQVLHISGWPQDKLLSVLTTVMPLCHFVMGQFSSLLEDLTK